MSKENVSYEYSLLNQLGEPIENKSDYTGTAVEHFANGDKFEGFFEKGVFVT